MIFSIVVVEVVLIYLEGHQMRWHCFKQIIHNRERLCYYASNIAQCILGSWFTLVPQPWNQSAQAWSYCWFWTRQPRTELLVLPVYHEELGLARWYQLVCGVVPLWRDFENRTHDPYWKKASNKKRLYKVIQFILACTETLNFYVTWQSIMFFRIHIWKLFSLPLYFKRNSI